MSVPVMGMYIQAAYLIDAFRWQARFSVHTEEAIAQDLRSHRRQTQWGASSASGWRKSQALPPDTRSHTWGH